MDIVIKDVLALLPEMHGAYTARKVSVCIKDGIIVSVGTVPSEQKSPEHLIDGSAKLMIPGFVNAHTHAYMTPLRNWADDLPFDKWLFDKIMPAEDSMTADEAYWGSMLSILEMVRGGTTTFLDMHMFPGAGARAAVDSSMRAVISRGLAGGGADAQGGERRLREAQEEIRDYGGFEGLSFMLAPHAPYTCDEGYLREISAVANSLGVGINTHLSESRGEISSVFEKYGATPVELYDRCELLGSKTVAAHCVHLTDNDMDILAERGVSVAHCPGSNLKLANGVAPVPDLLKRGVRICLGTDSAASNNSLSLIREMALAALLHKGIQGDPLSVSAVEAFTMASRNGALALGLDTAGEIREGFLADLALFDLNVPELTPLGDPASALVYGSAGITAHTVIVGGKIIMENGEFKTIDIDRVLFESRAAARRICKY